MKYYGDVELWGGKIRAEIRLLRRKIDLWRRQGLPRSKIQISELRARTISPKRRRAEPAPRSLEKCSV
eukprot:362873-Pleurochrysis_carterae.AAC.1